MPYPALNSAFDAIFPKGIRSYWKGSFVTELTDAAIERTSPTARKVPEVSATMHLYPINGACHRVGADDTAFAYRDATFATGDRVRPGRTRPIDKERIQWVRDYYEAIARTPKPAATSTSCPTTTRAASRTTTARTTQRLVEVKRTYDPDNLFHLNQNIPP